MPNEEEKQERDNSTPVPVSMAKKFILRDYKVEGKDIEAIRTNAEADELIAYLKERNEPEKEEEKQERGNMLGHETDFKLPDPENLTDELKLNMLDILKPLRVNNVINCRWGQDARILRHYDDEYPEGRIF